MQSAHKFAVAVPVGAWHPLFPSVLESLRHQSPPLEVALLDASSDPRVAEAVLSSRLPLNYHREGADDGQAAAIAEGWAHTSAEIIFWLNADDRLTPGALEIAEEAFASDPDLAVFFGGSDFIDEKGAVIGHHNQVADVSDLIFRSNIISQPSCFIRRKWVESVGGINQLLHYTMDWDLWIKLYKSGAKFERSEKILSQVYIGSGTKTEKINIQRMLEIARLVNENTSIVNTIKSVFAFTTHTASTRIQN